jgi:O-antigen/teichoic acid export membrane protein
MGVVRKQSILSSFFTYIGFAIGAINILFLFPKYFSPEELGLTRILLDVALLFSTACTLGSIPITLKFYPFYHAYLPKNKDDLPFITLTLCLTGCIIFLIIMPYLKPIIIRKFGARSPLFVDYFDLIYPLTITLAFFSLFEAYAWSLKRTVLSNALKEFAFRLLTTVLIALFVLGLVNFSQFINLYAFTFLVPIVIFFIALSRTGNFPIQIQISSVTRRLKSKIFAFGSFVFLGATLNIIARTNDTIIIASQSTGGLADAAVFTIATYLVTVMEVPQRSLISITTPFISEAWRSRNVARIDTLYKKTALNLLIPGIAIFCIVLLNAEDAVKFLGPSYGSLTMLVLILGIAKLIDLGSGLNTQILLLSKYWRIDFITTMLLVLVSIPLNYWLTRKYNVMGPAWGNLIALTTFNVIRMIYIWKIFRLQPFTMNNAKAILIGLICFVLIYLIPSAGNIYFDVIIRSALFIGLYAFAIIYFKASEDINGLVKIIRAKFNW